jgi:fructose-1-phosphate kinase PfkB-like protein
LFERFDHLLPTSSLVLLTGPAPDPFSTDIYAEMVTMCRRRGTPVFLDSRGGAFREAVRSIPTLVKPNEAEAAEWRGVPAIQESEYMSVVDEFRGHGIPWVVLTLGESGAIADCEGRRYRVVPPRIVTVNPVASGDTMVGAMAYAWTRGDSPETILRLGVAAGAANASVWGAAGCTREQVVALLDKVQFRQL